MKLANLLEEAAERIAPAGRMCNISDTDLGKRLRKEAKAAREFLARQHRNHLEDERKRASEPQRARPV